MTLGIWEDSQNLLLGLLLLHLHHTFSYLITGVWNFFICYCSIFTGFATTDPKSVRMGILTQLHFVMLQHLRGVWWYRNSPMDTSLLIRHWFDAEILRGNFVDISSILKGESTWKLWHRFEAENFNVDSTFKIDEISMIFPRGFFFVVSTSNRHNTAYVVSILLFPNIFCSGNIS